MSDSVRPHRRQSTRLPCPWDSPGKNTGVGCHFLLQCMKVKSEREVAQSCPTLRDPMNCSPRVSSIHGIFPGKSTGVGCHHTLQLQVLLLCRTLVAQSSLTLCYPMDCSLPVSSIHGIFPGTNNGVGNHLLLQGIFPIQGSNPGLLQFR